MLVPRVTIESLTASWARPEAVDGYGILRLMVPNSSDEIVERSPWNEAWDLHHVTIYDKAISPEQAQMLQVAADASDLDRLTEMDSIFAEVLGKDWKAGDFWASQRGSVCPIKFNYEDKNWAYEKRVDALFGSPTREVARSGHFGTSLSPHDVNGVRPILVKGRSLKVGFVNPSEDHRIAMVLFSVQRSTNGDGRDGDVIITENTTLTRQMNYMNLTVRAQLNMHGHLVYIRRFLSIEEGGELRGDLRIGELRIVAASDGLWVK